MKLGLNDHLCFKLYAASRLIIQGYGEELHHLGLTYAKYLVLVALADADGETVNTLGQKLYLDSGTLSPLLKSLEAQGFIRRERLADDSRVVKNYLTKSGAKALDAARKVSICLFEKTELSVPEFLDLRAKMKDFIERCQNVLEKSETLPIQHKKIKKGSRNHAKN